MSALAWGAAGAAIGALVNAVRLAIGKRWGDGAALAFAIALAIASGAAIVGGWVR